MKQIIYITGMDYTLKIINQKWKPQIIGWLGVRPFRTSELQKLLKTISQKVLTQNLKKLEEMNVIQRKSYNSVPPKVVYSLTKTGQEVYSLLADLSLWGLKQMHSDATLLKIPEDFSNY